MSEKLQNLQGLFFIKPIEPNCIGHIMEETYKAGIYEPFLPKKKEGSVCLDLGANLGITSYYFSSRFETIYAVEPAQGHFAVLKYMLEYNKITNVKPFKFAISMLDKPQERFFHYSNKTMHSLYGGLAGTPNSTGGLTQTGEEMVELKRIDTFMKEQNIEHVDLLKLDCEGIEAELFGSESFRNIAHKIDAIVGEIHGHSGRNPGQIVDALKINGFDFNTIQHDASLFSATRRKE